MSQLLQNLYEHQAWADAELWLAMEKFPPALQDKFICERFYHIHLVQRAFISVVLQEQFEMKHPEDFADMNAIKKYAMENHVQALHYAANITEEELQKKVTIPWFKDPPLILAVEQALTQAVMHSQHHRAQNATRLRELGGTPPTTDFIAWIWKGKPEATWK